MFQIRHKKRKLKLMKMLQPADKSCELMINKRASTPEKESDNNTNDVESHIIHILVLDSL